MSVELCRDWHTLYNGDCIVELAVYLANEQETGCLALYFGSLYRSAPAHSLLVFCYFRLSLSHFKVLEHSDP